MPGDRKRNHNCGGLSASIPDAHWLRQATSVEPNQRVAGVGRGTPSVATIVIPRPEIPSKRPGRDS
jgi:hypothetical protein